MAESRSRSFAPLFVTNIFGTMNDNFLKTLAGLVVVKWFADPALSPVFIGLMAALLVLPYILCSPLADRLTVVFAKRRIVQLAKWAELPIVALGIVGFAWHSAGLVAAAVLLMGLQSSLYSPAKYALIRDIGGEDRISTGMGGMEGVSFLGVLAGTIAASMLADGEIASAGIHWAWFCLVGLAVFGLIGSYTIRAEEEKNRAVHAISPIRYMRRAFRIAKGYPGLNAVIFTLSVFWGVAAMLQVGLLDFGPRVMRLSSMQTGVLLSTSAVGIVVGQVLAGFVGRRHFLLGATLVTGWIAAALLAVLFFVPMRPAAFGAVAVVLAFDLGFFKLPFDTEIQKVVKGPRLNTMLAYFNQVSFLFMLLASGCYALVSWLCGPRAFLLVLAVTLFLASAYFVLGYRKTLERVGRWVLARRYAVTIEGRDAFARAKGRTMLVLPNHPAMVDPMLLLANLGELKLKPLADEAFFKVGFTVPLILRTVGTVSVPDLRKHRSAKGAAAARGLKDVVLDALRRESNVIFYPAGHVQSEADRDEIGTRQLAYTVCRELPEDVCVFGIRTRGLWGSCWSRKGRNGSPNLIWVLVKSVFLWLFAVPFLPRRPVKVHVEDLTDRIREWSRLTRLEFNQRLEQWYNSHA